MLGLVSLYGFSQTSVNTVIAEKGDGIYSLLRKHGMSPAEHYGHFIALNKANLWDSIQLFEGREYILPPVEVDSVVVEASIQKKSTEIKEIPNVLEEGIFGKEHSLVTIRSNKLKGAVYYLISGHGGPDPGAVAIYDGKMIAEDEYAYDITLRLAKELMSHGAETFIIVRDPNDGIRDYKVLEIDRDEVVYPNEEIPLNQLQRLKQRVDVVNKLYLENSGKYQRLIVTHVDSRSKGQNIDVFFYHHEKSKNGKHLAESIHKTFLNKYREYQPNRSYEGTFGDRSGLYLVKNTLPAMAYIEIGNIKNKKDQRRILDTDNRQALAKWISEGVILDRDRKLR
ncbi:hypothetical protein KCTC52924_01771 [Arenibacter antarcticus]|nr:N-acetylmuramoyl-L-alanine amidase [Arenibacter sp. H213]MCM4166916.1 N-acetylmuramoyl-L-alanine amidase [Arenibacter sp. H213]